MKAILRIYIALVSCLTLISPATQIPVSPGITIRHRGILDSGLKSSIDQIDLITTSVSLLAWIAPAAFLLWKWDSISAWIKPRKNPIAISITAFVIAVVALAIVGTIRQAREDVPPQGTPALIIPANTTNPFLTLIPTAPATANQVRRATKANP